MDPFWESRFLETRRQFFGRAAAGIGAAALASVDLSHVEDAMSTDIAGSIFDSIMLSKGPLTEEERRAAADEERRRKKSTRRNRQRAAARGAGLLPPKRKKTKTTGDGGKSKSRGVLSYFSSDKSS